MRVPSMTRWDPAKKVYAKGGQTAHSLALALGCAPTPEIREAAVAHFVADITGNGNHTTCGGCKQPRPAPRTGFVLHVDQKIYR